MLHEKQRLLIKKASKWKKNPIRKVKFNKPCTLHFTNIHKFLSCLCFCMVDCQFVSHVQCIELMSTWENVFYKAHYYYNIPAHMHAKLESGADLYS